MNPNSQTPEGLQKPAEANRAFYLNQEANEPILLYKGVIEISQDGNLWRGDGVVRLEWIPAPGVHFQVTGGIADPSVHNGSAAVLLVDLGISVPTQVSHVSASIRESGSSVTYSGVIESSVEIGTQSEISRVTFHVPNFPQTLGEPIGTPDGSRSWLGRAVMKADGWRVTIDLLDSFSGLEKSLKFQSGYGVTHAGVLERCDGSTFTVPQAKEILEALRLFLSFARGRWTAPILPLGFDGNGNGVWEEWAGKKVDNWKTSSSWFTGHHPHCLSECFSGFLSRWLDPDSENVVRLATHWYLESNAGAISMEGSLVLALTGLELLSWAVLVEGHGMVSREGFEKLPASDKFRILLARCQIPLTIPQGVPEFEALAKNKKWVDVPHGLTEVRNLIIHPKRVHREALRDLPPRGKYEALVLAQWYLELVLLHLFGYRGGYSNRLKRPRGKWELESVPWVTPS